MSKRPSNTAPPQDPPSNERTTPHHPPLTTHSSPIHEFDLVVIGSGPAGEKGAAAAAYFGKRVALIEKEDHYGGAAANTGTLPSKTLRETALILSGLRQRQIFGLKFGLERNLRIQDFLLHERRVKDYERVRIRNNLVFHGVTVFAGRASFVDDHTVLVTPQRSKPESLRGEKILIATGSYPFRPRELFPFTSTRVFDSDTILSLYEIPRSMLVVGGGVIGCEYACMFAALGVPVTMVEKRGGLLGGVDREIAESLREQMSDAGMEIILEDEVAEVRNHPAPRVPLGQRGGEPPAPDAPLEVVLKSGRVLHPDAILVSSGRNGQTAGLELERVGIEVSERGHIKVNPKTFQTSVPHIYAAGDVIGNPALASTAMAQARMAVAHAFELPFNTGLAEMLPAGIFTIPECSSVGESEESLKKKGIGYVAGRAYYASNARGQIIGDSKGFLKLLFHEDDLELLGVHVIGEQATELIHIGLTALLMKAKAELFIHTCYNYPTLSELYKYAAYDALGKWQKRSAEHDGAAEPAREHAGRAEPTKSA
jgi:NAD(P) transhydrogenase